MRSVVLYRIDASRNMRRYYRLDVQPDLFGVWLLIREWGRIGQPGQTRVESFRTIGEAHAALQRQQLAKRSRGYADGDICSESRSAEGRVSAGIALATLACAQRSI